MNKKLMISHAVALVLGFLGGLLGADLSHLQAPAEQAVGAAVDQVLSDAGPVP